MDNKIDKGSILEYRILRLLFYMGYFAQIGVKLKTSNEDGALLITDMDVLGFQFNINFTYKGLWADCKSGQADKLNRISWINGVKQYYHVDDILLVVRKPRVEIKNFARKSNIQVLDLNVVKKLEHDFGIDEDNWCGSWNYVIQKDQTSTLKKISVSNNDMFKKIADFIESDYWIADEYARVKKTLTAIKQLAGYINAPIDSKEVKAIKWAINKLICLFLLATMSISRELYFYDKTSQETILRQRMLSGVLPEKKWNEIMLAANYYAHSIIKNQIPNFDSSINIPVIKAEPPAYFDAYYTLVDKLISHPKQTFDILRYLDYVLMEHDLNEKNFENDFLEKMFANYYELKITAKTILHFICHTAELDKTNFLLLS